MNTLDILKGMRTLLDDPAAWLQGEHSQTDDNASVTPIDPRARCWCLDGASFKVEGKDPEDRMTDAHMGAVGILNRAVDETFPTRGEGHNTAYVDFNDHDDTTHPDVILVLDRAIKIQEEASI